MAISFAFKLPIHSLVISFALAFVACASEGSSDNLGGAGGRIDDPQPSDGGAGARGPAPSEAGAAAMEDPDDEGGGGTGGGSGEPDPEPRGGAASEPEPEPAAGAGGRSSEEPEPEPEPPSEAELRGKALVDKNGCVTCHQPNFGGFSVFPNITPDPTSGIGAWTDEQIVKAIRDGVDADGASMCSTMARYPFSDEEVADVVAFLRGLPPVTSKAASTCPGHG